MTTAKPKAPAKKPRMAAAKPERAPAKSAPSRAKSPPKRPTATESAAAARPRRSKAASAPAPSHETIAHEAYLIWMAEGCPPGREVTHWLQAEQRLRAGS